MRALRPMPLSVSLITAAASAQAPAPAAPPQPLAPAPIANGSAESAAAADGVAIDPVQQSRVPVDPAERTGFSTGLRLGVGVPLGKAGQGLGDAERDLNDLTPWRAPVWLDLGYALSGSLTIGAYAQVGVGGV